MADTSARSGGTSRTGLYIMLGIAAALTLWFLYTRIPRYADVSPETYGAYWNLKGWMMTHILGGSLALLIGPYQIWSGVTRSKMKLHRVTGSLYLLGILLGSLSAVFLVIDGLSRLPVFSMGLAGLTTAWLVTSGMAFMAIRRKNYTQHMEWMIRSYVVTLAFVTFRIIEVWLGGFLGLSFPDLLAVSGWASWALPLLITEAFIQGKKI